MTKTEITKTNDKSIYIILAMMLALIIAIGLFLFRNIENMNHAKFEFLASKITQLENRVKVQGTIIKNLKNNKQAPLLNIPGNLNSELKTQHLYNALINSPAIFNALNNLKVAINKGTPFVKELQAITALLPNLVLVFEPIKPIAATGVLSTIQLSDQLSALLTKNKTMVNETWKGDILNKLNSLVEVNKAPDTIDTKIAQIKTHLTNGNLAQAQTEAKKLNIPGINTWLYNLQNLTIVANILLVNNAYLLRSMIIAEEMKR